MGVSKVKELALKLQLSKIEDEHYYYIYNDMVYENTDTPTRVHSSGNVNNCDEEIMLDEVKGTELKERILIGEIYHLEW